MSVLPLSSIDLGRMIGRTDRQVRRLHRDGVLPKMAGKQRTKFDAFVCVPLFLAYVSQGAEKSTGVANSRQALVDAQRKALELKTRRSEGELIPAEEVAQGFEAAMTAVGASLDGIGGRLCGELATITDAAVIRARIFDECRRIRNTAASALEALAGVTAGGEGAQGAHAKVARRMGGRVSRAT
jgi:hypothetical protein